MRALKPISNRGPPAIVTTCRPGQRRVRRRPGLDRLGLDLEMRDELLDDSLLVGHGRHPPVEPATGPSRRRAGTATAPRELVDAEAQDEEQPCHLESEQPTSPALPLPLPSLLDQRLRVGARVRPWPRPLAVARAGFPPSKTVMVLPYIDQ